MLVLNLHQAWMIATAQHELKSMMLPPLATPSSPRASDAVASVMWDSTKRTATWMYTTDARPRVVRVSSVRAQDASLFHQLGLDVQVVDSGGAPHQDGSSRRERTRGHRTDASDLLLLPWRLPVAATPLSAAAANETLGKVARAASMALTSTGASAVPSLHLDSDVLWGQWTSHLQFFDPRLRRGQLINSFMGLEHDTLGTPHAFARSHQRCVRTWGLRACNFTSTQLVLHSHHDVSRLETLFGAEELGDLQARAHARAWACACADAVACM